MTRLAVLLALIVSTTIAQVNGQEVKIFSSLSGFLEGKYEMIDSPLTIEKRTIGDIRAFGGNDYKITSPDRKSRKTIKKKTWAVERNDSLFLNCRHHGLGPWYSYAELLDEFVVFYAAVPLTEEQRASMGFGGAIGGAIIGASLATARTYYVIDIEWKRTKHLDLNVMKKMLRPYPELLSSYEAEGQYDSEETIEHYLQELRLMQ